MKPELTAQILGMYIGRPCDVLDTDGEFLYTGIFSLPNLDYWTREMYALRPHLRRLEGITEEECKGLYLSANGTEWDRAYECMRWLDFDDDFGYGSMLGWCIGNPAAWLYLLSRGFDLFGLIDAGLAKEVEQ